VFPGLASRRFWSRHPAPVGSSSKVGWRGFWFWRVCWARAAASAAGEIGNASWARNNVRGRLKQMVAEQALDIQALKAVVSSS
jgi:hypothetical protein